MRTAIWKPFAAVMTAAVLAGAITGFPGLESVSAGQSSPVAIQSIPANDRGLERCSPSGWPYQACHAGTPRATNVRLVTTDRLSHSF